MKQSTFEHQEIICFAGEDWWFHNPHSNRHLMESFAKSNRVLFVNSTGIRMPDLKSDRFFWRRVFNKLKSFLRYLKKADANLYVLTPLALPLIKGKERAIGIVNKALLIVQMRIIIFMLRMKRPVIWVTAPAARDIALYLKSKLGSCLVYYCVDNLAHFPE